MSTSHSQSVAAHARVSVVRQFLCPDIEDQGFIVYSLFQQLIMRSVD